MSLLIILVGASFRLGGNKNLNLGSDESYSEQKLACESHVKLAEHIKAKLNVSASFLIDTYSTKFSEDLKTWYSPFPTTFHSHKPFQSYPWLLEHAISIIPGTYHAYDGLLFVRLDLFLQSEFISNFKVFDKVMFSHVLYLATANHRPVVNDLILFIPRQHYGYLASNTVSLNHCSYNRYSASDIGFFVSTRHDSDSAKDWNPLYRIVNRPEAPRICTAPVDGEGFKWWCSHHFPKKFGSEEHCPGAESLSRFPGNWADDDQCPKLPMDEGNESHCGGDSNIEFLDMSPGCRSCVDSYLKILLAMVWSILII